MSEVVSQEATMEMTAEPVAGWWEPGASGVALAEAQRQGHLLEFLHSRYRLESSTLSSHMLQRTQRINTV